jgi:putative transposase
VRRDHPALSVSHQCRLLEVNRSTLAYKPVVADIKDKPVMDAIDRIMTEFPYYGSRKVTEALRMPEYGLKVGRERVLELLRRMGLRATQPRQKKGGKRQEHAVYPYLLDNLVVTAPQQVWCTDISYIPTRYGWVYLVAILDLFSRKILGWQLSATLEATPCIQLLKEMIEHYGAPAILNQDQGVQYTSLEWIAVAQSHRIQLSMAGKGRCYDNIHRERFWRSLKQEEVYLTEYVTLKDARQGISQYIEQYNHRRLHQNLGYNTPEAIFKEGSIWKKEEKRTEDNVLLCVQ